jgi:hypothetical protein
MPNKKKHPQHEEDPKSRRGEEAIEREGKEPGRYDEGTPNGKRPAGKSTARDATGVNPKEPIDPNSPTLIPE